MFLHKYDIKDVGTVYLLNGKSNPGQLSISLPGKGATVAAESVKNFLNNINSKFKEEPLPVEEEKAPEEEKPEEKKATLASAIRSFASILKD